MQKGILLHPIGSIWRILFHITTVWVIEKVQITVEKRWCSSNPLSTNYGSNGWHEFPHEGNCAAEWQPIWTHYCNGRLSKADHCWKIQPQWHESSLSHQWPLTGKKKGSLFKNKSGPEKLKYIYIYWIKEISFWFRVINYQLFTLIPLNHNDNVCPYFKAACLFLSWVPMLILFASFVSLSLILFLITCIMLSQKARRLE